MKSIKIINIIAWIGTILYSLVGLAHIVLWHYTGIVNFPGFISTMFAATISTLLILTTK